MKNEDRKKYTVGNWKMNCNLSEAHKLISEIVVGLKHLDWNNIEIILCPPFTALSCVKSTVKEQNLGIKLGAQNCHFMPCGAYTGEVSPKMIRDFCDYVILGHSERRKYFYEDDAIINKKIKMALEYGLKPIICVGEWKKGDNKAGILYQVKEAIKGLQDKAIKNLIFAYEPVWAIGTGDQPDPSYTNKIIKEIKEVIRNNVPVLYGGSIDSSNILGFIKQKMIDGFLIGGASLKAKEFLKIIKNIKKMEGTDVG